MYLCHLVLFGFTDAQRKMVSSCVNMVASIMWMYDELKQKTGMWFLIFFCEKFFLMLGHFCAVV